MKRTQKQGKEASKRGQDQEDLSGPRSNSSEEDEPASLKSPILSEAKRLVAFPAAVTEERIGRSNAEGRSEGHHGLPDDTTNASESVVPTAPLKRGLGRTDEERQAKSAARRSKAPTSGPQLSFKRGLARTAEEREAKVAARRSNASTPKPQHERESQDEATTTERSPMPREQAKLAELENGRQRLGGIPYAKRNPESAGNRTPSLILREREQAVFQRLEFPTRRDQHLPTVNERQAGINRQEPPDPPGRSFPSDQGETSLAEGDLEDGRSQTDLGLSPTEQQTNSDMGDETDLSGDHSAIAESDHSNEAPPVSGPEQRISRENSQESSLEEDLVVANPVEESSVALPQALEIDLLEQERNKQERTRRYRLGIGGLLLLAALVVTGVALAAVFMLKPKEEDVIVFATPAPNFSVNMTGSPSLEPTQAPTTTEEHLMSLLPTPTLETIQVEPASAQALAFEWLINDTTTSNYTDGRIIQRFALSSLFYATGGADWFENEGWLNYSTHECHWYSTKSSQMPGGERLNKSGISCQNLNLPGRSNPTGMYTNLNLEQNGLVRTVPPEVHLLSHLDSLSLSTNPGLAGPLPTEIGLLTHLRFLSLSGNKISGTLPSEVGMMADLMILSVPFNQIRGTIPSQIGLLLKLDSLALSFNNLNSTIPSELGQMSHMVSLVVTETEISGSIPSQVGLLSNLEECLLFANRLNSTIPTQLGGLLRLTDLALVENSLSGPIPSQLGSLASLKKMRLRTNRLTSSIPASTGRLSRLSYLELDQNSLSSVIPSQIGKLSLLEECYLTTNLLTNSIPTEIGSMTTLAMLALYLNSISGPIPSEIGLATKLKEIFLGDNLLSSLPSEMGKLESMDHFGGMNNLLEGSLPSEIGHMTSLTSLLLDNNQMTGSVPVLGLLAEIQTVNLKQNALFGPINTEMGLLHNLTFFSLRNNRISGNIPSEFGILPHLVTLWLPDNLLSGTVPLQIGLLAASGGPLKHFNVSNNSLTGRLPGALCSIDLMDFTCSESALCGCDCQCLATTESSTPGIGDLLIGNPNPGWQQPKTKSP